MTKNLATISKVVDSNLCTGCGACAGLFADAIEMVEDPAKGRRPVVSDPFADQAAMAVCAGPGAPRPAMRDEIDAEWGPVLKTWEGYAADDEIRYRGSSGGAVTALAKFALESGEASAVAHIAASVEDARRNVAVLSRNRTELLRGAGSRYAQASPAEWLGDIAAGDEPAVFIGKPCDVASARRGAQTTSELSDNLALTIGIFCAGAPNLNATDGLLDRLDVPREARVTALRYRGYGWPGMMQAKWVDNEGHEHTSRSITYAEGWGEVLQAGRQWRCRICDDHTGAFADISVGDPWHAPPKGQQDTGRSLIVARTPRGVAIVEAAMAAGALIAEERGRDIIAKAQPNLAATNAAVWGRRLAMKLIGLHTPVPVAARFTLWRNRLGLKAKLQSVLGAWKRLANERAARKT